MASPGIDQVVFSQLGSGFENAIAISMSVHRSKSSRAREIVARSPTTVRRVQPRSAAMVPSARAS